MAPLIRRELRSKNQANLKLLNLKKNYTNFVHLAHYLWPILIQIYSVDNLGGHLIRNLTPCQEQLPISDTKNNVISAFVQSSVRCVDHQKTLTQNITLKAKTGGHVFYRQETNWTLWSDGILIKLTFILTTYWSQRLWVRGWAPGSQRGRVA